MKVTLILSLIMMAALFLMPAVCSVILLTRLCGVLKKERSGYKIGVDEKTVVENACRLEHNFSADSFEKLKNHIENYHKK